MTRCGRRGRQPPHARRVCSPNPSHFIARRDWGRAVRIDTRNEPSHSPYHDEQARDLERGEVWRRARSPGFAYESATVPGHCGAGNGRAGGFSGLGAGGCDGGQPFFRSRGGQGGARDFLGFSYETAELSDQAFFAADNSELVSLFKVLSSEGVLRLGGNSSEFCWWKTKPDDKPPELARVRPACG